MTTQVMLSLERFSSARLTRAVAVRWGSSPEERSSCDHVVAHDAGQAVGGQQESVVGLDVQRPNLPQGPRGRPCYPGRDRGRAGTCGSRPPRAGSSRLRRGRRPGSGPWSIVRAGPRGGGRHGNRRSRRRRRDRLGTAARRPSSPCWRTRSPDATGPGFPCWPRPSPRGSRANDLVVLLGGEPLADFLGDDFDGHFAGLLAGELATHAVGDDEQARRSRSTEPGGSAWPAPSGLTPPVGRFPPPDSECAGMSDGRPGTK